MDRADGVGEPARLVDDRPGLAGLAGLWAASLRRLGESRALRRSFLWWGGLGFILNGAFAVGVAQMQSGRAAVVAGVASLVWWLMVSAVPVISASLLTTPEGERVDRLGVPNALTLIRAYSCPGLILCAVVDTPHRIGFILWATVGAVAAVLDLVDGYIARRVGPVTRLGQVLDPIMDSVFFSMAAVGNITLGIVPNWFGGLMVARYMGPLAFGIAFQLAGRRPEVTATVWGKRTTILTSVALAVLLVVRSVDGPTQPVALLFAIPLAAMTLLHFAVMVGREREAPVAGRVS